MPEMLRTPSTLPTLFQRPDRTNDDLHCLTTVFNPARYRSRWRLYNDFAMHVAQSGGILYTCEIALGNREFVVTEPGNPHHLQLRTMDEMWHKEVGLNLLAQRLPPEAQKIAYIDADFHFCRPDFVDETRQQLEHFPIVQMWSELHNLSPHHKVIGSMHSFVDIWQSHGDIPVDNHHRPHKYRHPWGAPGGAWAMWREVWEVLGGLLDWCILGSGDFWAALAVTSQAERIIRHTKDGAHGLTGVLGPLIIEYQRRAEAGRWRGRPIARNIGLVPGTVLHAWHGPLKDRGYETRGMILAKNDFRPDLDLKRDLQGLYTFSDRVPQLRRDVHHYLASRNEDALS